MANTVESGVTAETARLDEARERDVPWRQWGPYLSERQWGTVREDYSEDGNAWDYFSHDQARSRAYHWGEDGLAGLSDDHQRLCFSPALWNGKDAILKERLFGLTNSEGNHGEDVKEYYFYLDNTPTHSYMKYLYKYPQSSFPYSDLVETNRRRGRSDPEYELLDTGVFDGNRYFDVLIEYAKATPGRGSKLFVLTRSRTRRWNSGSAWLRPRIAPLAIMMASAAGALAVRVFRLGWGIVPRARNGRRRAVQRRAFEQAGGIVGVRPCGRGEGEGDKAGAGEHRSLLCAFPGVPSTP